MTDTTAAGDQAVAPGGEAMANPRISIATPAYNEAANLPQLYERLCAALERDNLSWEWVLVDDHSGDDTFGVIREIAARDPRVRGIRLARNAGSHMALTCALHAARGDCAIALAADLQDPPEMISQLLAQWRAGHHVVWATRAVREGEGVAKRGLARLYYWLMRNVVGFAEMPPQGADFFLLDRRVLEALRQFRESNVSLLALITWLGFRQTHVPYTKRARPHGESGWTARKKLKLLVDSVTAFSYAPLRLITYFGFLVAAVGFGYAAVVIVNALAGTPPAGWSALMVVVLLLCGTLMLMMGVLGEYLWRALDESRRRPQYIVEETVGVTSNRADDSERRSLD